MGEENFMTRRGGGRFGRRTYSPALTLGVLAGMMGMDLTPCRVPRHLSRPGCPSHIKDKKKTSASVAQAESRAMIQPKPPYFTPGPAHAIGTFILDHQKQPGRWRADYENEFGILTVCREDDVVFKAVASRHEPARGHSQTFWVIAAAPELSYRPDVVTDLGALQERLSETLL